MENTSLKDKIETNIYAGMIKDKITNDDLCSIIKLSLTLINATDVKTYADKNGKSYNGIKKFDKNYRKIKHLNFVINNE